MLSYVKFLAFKRRDLSYNSTEQPINVLIINISELDYEVRFW